MMSGFHPILGLLAVAVCISFANGAAFSFILNNESTANKRHESNSDRPPIARKYDNSEARILNKNSKHTSLSEDKDQQNAGILTARNTAYNNRASGFSELSNLRTAGENGLRRQAAPADSASGSIDDKSNSRSGLVSNGGKSEDGEGYSSSYENTEEDGDGGQSDNLGLGSAVPGSDENCEDNEGTTRSTQGSSSAPTSRPASTPTKQNVTTHSEPHNNGSGSGDSTESSSQLSEESEESQESEEKHSEDHPTSHSTTTPTTKPSDDSNGEGSEEECEEDEPTDGGSSSASSSQGPPTPTEEPEDEECEETEEPDNAATSTTATTSKKPPKRPADDNKSSGSFGDTDEHGLLFSESNSDESSGKSTALSWKR